MEKILYSNSFNQTEYLRTLAKIGQNTFGLRVMNDVELCSYILEHGDKLPKGSYISSKEEDYIYFHLVGGSFNDAKNLRTAIDTYRDSVQGDLLKAFQNNLSDDFPEKKKLIQEKYELYVQYKKEHSLYDKNDLVEFVLNSDLKLNIECLYYKEMGITKVFLEMLKKVFSNIKELSLLDTFPEKQKNIKFIKAYGRPCEIDYVFSQIQKLPIDECQIVLTNNSDALEIIKTAQVLKVPFTSRIGIPIISTKVGVLLSYLFNLEDALYGVDGYRELFNCYAFNAEHFKALIPSDYFDPDRYFNEFIKNAGWLRLGFDGQGGTIEKCLYEPEMCEMLTLLESSLAEGRSSFIRKFIKNTDSLEPIEESVINQIEQIEKASKKYDIDTNEMLRELLTKNIDKKIAKSGTLFITDIASAISSLRKYNFVVGLNSDYPGGPKENYLIYDEEYAKTGSLFYDSKEIVKRKDVLLRTFIKACEDLSLSYSFFDLASLENINPSSIYFDLYNGDVSKMPIYGYKDLKLDANKEVYASRIDNKVWNGALNKLITKYDPVSLLYKKYSPSSFNMYFKNETKLAFILANFFDINIADEDDPYQVIASNDMGELIHGLMEDFQKEEETWISFRERANRAFDSFLLKKPPLIPSSAEKERKEFMRLVENVYKEDPNNEHVLSEKSIKSKIEGILFGGRFDRLEKERKTGKYILVDYKTGASVNHIAEDTITCIQGLIYAYLIEERYKYQNIKIDRIEFRYPSTNETIPIHYSASKKAEMIEKVKEFKQDIENGKFFNDIDLDKQKYIDKYAYLFSLLKEVSKHE